VTECRQQQQPGCNHPPLPHSEQDMGQAGRRYAKKGGQLCQGNKEEEIISYCYWPPARPCSSPQPEPVLSASAKQHALKIQANL